MTWSNIDQELFQARFETRKFELDRIKTFPPIEKTVQFDPFQTVHFQYLVLIF